MKILLLSLLLLTQAFATEIGTVKFTKGIIQALDSKTKKKRNLKKGDRVRVREVIISGSKSLALIALDSKSNIKLNATSAITLSEYAHADGTSKIKVNKGSAFFNVFKNKDRSKVKFRVTTRTASLGVRGTTFYVGLSKSESGTDTWMCVKEGIVETSRIDEKSKSVNVLAGQGVRVSLYDKMSKPRALPWTKGLNWAFEGDAKELENELELKDAYKDILDQDYD